MNSQRTDEELVAFLSRNDHVCFSFRRHNTLIYCVKRCEIKQKNANKIAYSEVIINDRTLRARLETTVS